MKVTQSYPTLCNPMDCTYSPWNSPGQNTGAGSLSLLQWTFPTQGSNPGLLHCKWILYQLSYRGGLYSPWNSPHQNPGVGSRSLLQGIFPTQGLNLGLLHCKWILYQLSHKGNPKQTVWIVKNALHTLPSAFKDLTGKRLLLRNSGLTETLELLIERKKQNEC